MDPIAAAVARLHAGGLVAFPTETVYGLGADATNPEAVRRIFEAKGRPADHPVIVHLADVSRIGDWARAVPDAALKLAAAFWPGPMTLVLPRQPGVADIVTGGQDTVGIRIPSHPVAQALLQAFGRGVAGPSANRFGHISPTTAEHVRGEFGNRVDLILEGGPSEVGIESTIVDLSGTEPVLLRPGMISTDALEAVLGRSIGLPGAASPRVSGSLASHYAPRTPAILMDADDIDTAWRGPEPRLGVLARRPNPGSATRGTWVHAPADAASYAHDLYANLRMLDAAGCSRLLVEAVPAGVEWLAVRDRLSRATTPAEP